MEASSWDEHRPRAPAVSQPNPQTPAASPGTGGPGGLRISPAHKAGTGDVATASTLSVRTPSSHLSPAVCCVPARRTDPLRVPTRSWRPSVSEDIFFPRPHLLCLGEVTVRDRQTEASSPLTTQKFTFLKSQGRVALHIRGHDSGNTRPELAHERGDWLLSWPKAARGTPSPPQTTGQVGDR